MQQTSRVYKSPKHTIGQHTGLSGAVPHPTTTLSFDIFPPDSHPPEGAPKLGRLIYTKSTAYISIKTY